MDDRVPDGFGPSGGIVVADLPARGAAGLGGDRVDDLAVGERITVPVEVGLQVRRRPGHPRADDEPHVRLVQGLQVRRRQHPGVGGDREVGQAVPFGELGDDRDQRAGLGLVALVAADLQREALTVDE